MQWNKNDACTIYAYKGQNNENQAADGDPEYWERGALHSLRTLHRQHLHAHRQGCRSGYHSQIGIWSERLYIKFETVEKRRVADGYCLVSPEPKYLGMCTYLVVQYC